MGDGIWTGDSYIPDVRTLGDLGVPGGYRNGSSDIGLRWIANAGYAGSCRFGLVDVAGEAL